MLSVVSPHSLLASTTSGVPTLILFAVSAGCRCGGVTIPAETTIFMASSTLISNTIMSFLGTKRRKPEVCRSGCCENELRVVETK